MLQYTCLRICSVQTVCKKSSFVSANPAHNYSIQIGNISIWRTDIVSPCTQERIPKSAAFVANKVSLWKASRCSQKWGSIDGKKRPGQNAKSHLKPPESTSSFEDPDGSQILFAVAYIYLSAAFVTIHTYIDVYIDAFEGGFLSALTARDHYSVAVGCL